MVLGVIGDASLCRHGNEASYANGLTDSEMPVLQNEEVVQ